VSLDPLSVGQALRDSWLADVPAWNYGWWRSFLDDPIWHVAWAADVARKWTWVGAALQGAADPRSRGPLAGSA